MARIIGVHHTSFTIAHLESSVAFFRELLGCEPLYQREVREDYFGRIVGLPGCKVKAALFRLPGGHHLELFEYLEPRGEPHHPRPCDPGSAHISLLTDDLPALHEQLAARGVEFVSPPVQVTAGANRGGYGVYLRDPNGILVELFQAP
jgi:catechol 2,3-dioxygenase-like lactoylglutathione lyase family enzyme